MEKISANKCHDGTVSVYKHESIETACDMRFSVFLPPQAAQGAVPVLFWLSGLTCTEENFTTKAGAYKTAAERGLAIVAPDTSPRGENVPNDAAYDLGQGAGFYIDATQSPWAKNFRMESYIARELPAFLKREFPQLDLTRLGVSGHSMGGHGALTLFFKHRDVFRSVSAFSPIVAPTLVPWGRKAFAAYLGDDKNAWQAHDASALAVSAQDVPEILVDVGTADPFLDEQLKPTLFEEACAKANIPLMLRRQDGYDHSYYFVQSFIADHLAHHARILMHV